VLICYEVAFDDVARSTIAAGAQVLAVPTNNATYSGTAQPAQQLAMSQFRAVELDRAVLVAATTGVSAIIRRDGTVLASLGDAASGALTAQVELRDSVTPAARWGGQLTLAMALLAALSVFWEIASPIRRRWSPRLG
jgi:apolipoprotein N-acyltransferase